MKSVIFRSHWMLRTLSSVTFPLLGSTWYTPMVCCRGSITVNTCLVIAGRGGNGDQLAARSSRLIGRRVLSEDLTALAAETNRHRHEPCA